MMEQVGKVISTDADGWVRVEVQMKSACSHCSQSDSCGTSAISKAFNPRVQQFSLPTNEHYAIGTLLKLGLPESVILKAAALVYLLPLIGLFIGGVLGSGIAASLDINLDATSALFAVIVALLAWRYGKYRAVLMEQSAQPVILANLGCAIATDGVNCHS
ncbi:SoxR reducing system RseC family protein [Shewanella avicenniae]|uniref:SoxR reducing system RseC family protein n=1 Tax=Shewanella avicenniae TaxID=2814294 RepID=A0ABX7QTA6_9GAMM|nr:SoxR reducing system RseC family protein [Shewanella avicenniae]QSX34709.1 SoxR reducing system RseC family protein [Shewanella avicenniae]